MFFHLPAQHDFALYYGATEINSFLFYQAVLVFFNIPDYFIFLDFFLSGL